MTSLHERLLATNSLLHVSAAGAGLRLQTALWDTPGASAYLVGFFTPYARTQLHSFLGHAPETSYCSSEVAYDLAMASYLRAAEHRIVEGSLGNPVGIGITAAVASSRLSRGGHRAHVVIITHDVIREFVVEFENGAGIDARIAHDEQLRDRVLVELGLVLDGSAIASKEASTVATERFYRYPVFDTNGRRYPASGDAAGIYLPATLNPIHDGHRLMCRVAESRGLSAPGEARFAKYLVSSCSPHKGNLSVQEMLFKAGMLRAERWRNESRMVEFTRDEPLFLDKARKRPGSIFLIGADTMMRMLETGWGPNIVDMLSEMRKLGTRFWVMDRQQDGNLLSCRDIEVPSPFQTLFEPLDGQLDISSTELRLAETRSTERRAIGAI